MSEYVKMTFDDGGFTYFLQNIRGSKLKQALKSGLRKTLNIIKQKAAQNLKAVSFKSGSVSVDKAILFTNNQGAKYVLPSFRKGIMTKVSKDGTSGRVELIGRGDNYNPILKMIEAGKGDRKTKGKKGKSHSTGSITHTFFTDAVTETKDKVQTALQKHLDDVINKAHEKWKQGKR